MRVSNISWLAKQSEIRWDEENTISLSVRSGMWRLGETVSNSKIGQARPIARHWKRERRRRWREKKQAANHTILCDCYCRYRNDAMERDGECVTSKSDSLKKNINRSLSDLTRFKMLNGCQAHTHTHTHIHSNWHKSLHGKCSSFFAQAARSKRFIRWMAWASPSSGIFVKLWLSVEISDQYYGRALCKPHEFCRDLLKLLSGALIILHSDSMIRNTHSASMLTSISTLLLFLFSPVCLLTGKTFIYIFRL